MKAYAMMFNQTPKCVFLTKAPADKCVRMQNFVFDNPRYTGPRYIVWVKEYDATPTEV